MRTTSRLTTQACVLAGIALAAAMAPINAHADEGGVSFWLPGQFGSLAAVPGEPGWSLAAVYYHDSADASRSKNFTVGGNVVGGIDGHADLLFLAAQYIFPEPLWGGQAALMLTGAGGRMKTTADVTVTGPLGNLISQSQTDTLDAGADLYPLASIKWNAGVDNYMVYMMGDIPTGAYRKGRLANIGIGHGAIDGGGGYTYFDTKNGHEFSIVGGVTYNFENNDTDYKNGVDGHVDWAASQFLSEATHVGIVGYNFFQLSGDSGSGAVLGPFKSRTNGVGPQVGHFFPVNGSKGYVNLKAYWEYGAANRASGWNLWLSLLLPLSPPPSKP